MKNIFRSVSIILFLLVFAVDALAQMSIKASLVDSASGEPISFATVSLTRQGATKPTSYVLSADDGKVNMTGVRKGNYIFKAELTLNICMVS